MRKTITATALTVAGLAASAGAASADTTTGIDHNEHGNATGDGINVSVSDVLTNTNVQDVIGDVHLLDEGVNVLNEG